jgi:hypothetical protein
MPRRRNYQSLYDDQNRGGGDSSDEDLLVQQRAQVLDSDDEASDNDGGESSASLTASATTINGGNSLNGRSRRLAQSYMNSQNGGDKYSSAQSPSANGNANVSPMNTSLNESHHESDTDDELMNPYIMNPFVSSGLMPPSMEMSTLSGNSSGEGGENDARDAHRNSAHQQQQQHSQQWQTQQQNQQSQLHRQRHQQQTLPTFDPYSPINARVQQLRAQDELLHELEFEGEEESIDFLSTDGASRGDFSNCSFNNRISGEATASWRGDLLHEKQSTTLGEEPSFESSFSPFPKHSSSSSRNNVYVGEYGESIPLSGRARGSPKASAPGGARGVASSLLNVVKAVISSASYTASSLLYGNNPSTRFNNRTRFDGRTRGNNMRHHWGMLSYFRLFVIAMAALFALGTMTMVRHVMISDGAAETTAVKSNFMTNGQSVDGSQEEYAQRPNSLVIKKMEKAKKRWWSKLRHGGSDADANEGGQPSVEVYHNGEKTDAVVANEPSSIVEANETDNHDKVVGEHLQQVPIIVETGEDGSLLIKLPPPKLHLEQPPPQLGGSDTVVIKALESEALALRDGEDDETMYIRLPYPEQRRVLSDDTSGMTREELNSPLLGDYNSLSSHPNLIRRPPPPLAQSSHERKVNAKHHHLPYSAHEEHHPGVLNALRNEFESWREKHGKKYGSSEEKEERFHVWKNNHFGITEKNMKHGPCSLTGKAVFGHNVFSDLAPEEFQQRYLTGYHGPKAHVKENHSHTHQAAAGARGVSRGHKKNSDGEVDPPPLASVKRHPSIQRKLNEYAEEVEPSRLQGTRYKSSSFAGGCQWWDVSCMLRYVFGYQYIGGTREPVYDESSYPSALDWRNLGVVSSVHAQGSCGACWAITAVETIESAYAIATGNLLDLSEDEVIACDGSCEMCNGGWPQNAYKYVMKHGGLPVQSSNYDGDFLSSVTAVLAGESYDVSEYEMSSYFAKTCPSGVREGGNGNAAEDGDNSKSASQDYSSNSGAARYGKIKVRPCQCFSMVVASIIPCTHILSTSFPGIRIRNQALHLLYRRQWM